ncbi:MAG: hypothetical protein WD334_07175, partial [Chitinophagales bacterium]
TGFKNNIIGSSSDFGTFDERMINLGLFMNVKAIHRPLRFLGVGAEVSFPLVQGTMNNTYDYQYYGASKPQGFKYSAKQAFGLTAIASLFADTEANFHVDFRFSYVSFKEEFEFLSNYNIVSYEEKINLPAAGFALGFMPHLTDHLFFDINFGFDLLLIGSDPGFSYTVDYQRVPFDQDYVILESQLTDLKTSIFINIGLGYYF